jgi:hypothetical protein
MGVVGKIKDKVKRHQERHTSSGYQTVISESIEFVNQTHWQEIAFQGSVFLSRAYLTAIEANSPENTLQRYAIAYKDSKPVAIVVCQVAEITGNHLTQASSGIKGKLADNFKERVLVCGNLVSSGLHGVAFDSLLDKQVGWKIVAEILYKIRRGEKLNGKIDFTLIKDIKGEEFEDSKVVERFSYRQIQTDPDMILSLADEVNNFEDYLAILTSKYRNRIKKIIKTIDTSGYISEKIKITPEIDKQLHPLYLQVENKSDTRLATLTEGYFYQLSENLKDNFVCYVIKNQEHIAGFITVIKDGSKAIAYYVGIDYSVNKKLPIYFRLLQLVIESALEMNCKEISFGRTALEPKASLGAKPVDTYVWARHRVPVVNFAVRKLFRNVPFDEAPVRNVTK